MQRFGNIFSGRGNFWEVFGRNKATGLGLVKKNGIFSDRYASIQFAFPLGKILPTLGQVSGKDQGAEC
jgi:hypothetical protein